MSNRAKTERDLRPSTPTVWLTRDSDACGIWDMVDVWVARPTRYVDPDGGAFWQTSDEGRDKIKRVHVNFAWQDYRTIPDNDRECVRIGE